MSKPDGYIVQFKDGSMMECDDDHNGILYRPENKITAEVECENQNANFNNGGMVKPVWLSETPPVPKELLEWVEKVRFTLRNSAITSKLSEALSQLEKIWPEKLAHDNQITEDVNEGLK